MSKTLLPGLVDGTMEYPFDVVESIVWLADHVDMILCFFDPIGGAYILHCTCWTPFFIAPLIPLPSAPPFGMSGPLKAGQVPITGGSRCPIQEVRIQTTGGSDAHHMGVRYPPEGGQVQPKCTDL